MNTENWIKLVITILYGTAMYAMGYFIGRVRLFSNKKFQQLQKDVEKMKGEVWK